jgi:uncharacterized membrane protein YjjB (DUF3815 family)
MTALDLLQDIVLAAVPAVGFGMLFNVPRNVLGYCAILGGLGHGLRFALVKAEVPIELATLVAASAISFVGVWWAQALRAHPKVFTVAAVIPMIPGVPLFTTLITIQQIYQRGTSQELLTQAVNSGLRATFIIAALAVGLAMPGLVLFRRRPVV